VNESSEAEGKKDEKHANGSKEKGLEMEDEVGHDEHYREGGECSVSL